MAIGRPDSPFAMENPTVPSDAVPAAELATVPADGVTVDATGGGPAAVATENSAGGFLLLSGYAAGNLSPSRGYLYWPETKTRFELPPIAAAEIRRRIHWLYANFGFARRLIRGMAKMAGTITPYADTGSDAWDDLVSENFMERTRSPEVFDVAGKFDFWGAQFQLDVNRFKDGDCLIAPTDPDGWDGVQMAIYEGTQISDDGSWTRRPYGAARDTIDGVKTDPFGKHLEYRVQEGFSPGDFKAIPAASAYYFGNLESHHAVRGLSILAAAVVDMVDVVETRGFTKKRLKEHANIGTVVETDAPAIFPGGGGFGAPIVQTTVPLPGNKTETVSWAVMSGGGQIPNLAPGQKIKVVADDRPTPNNMEFEKALLKNCVWAADLPFEALCDLAGVSGPGMRFILAEIKRWVANQFHFKARWVRWYRAIYLANEIKAGRLPDPAKFRPAGVANPNWWLRAEYIGQSDMTIDEGRKGNLALVNLESGLTTWADEWAEKGAYWKQRIRQRVKEYALARDECAKIGATVSEVFPKLGGPPAPTGAPGEIPPVAAA